jgi:ATP-dependent DNA ligase
VQRRQGIMLCYPFEEKRLDTWAKPYLVQPKLDGDRCRAIFDEDGVVTLLSSEEHEIRSVPHIIQQLESLCFNNLELDGELYLHKMHHQSIHGIVGRTVNIHPDSNSMEYHIFDVVETGTQMERIARHDFLKFQSLSVSIKVVPTLAALNLPEIMSIMELYTAGGYEGIVVRNPRGVYARKRSTDIMKFKPRKDDFYTIIGFEEEISIHGEPKNALGALILKSDTEQIFKVGSGSFLTRDNRERLWVDRESMIGKVAHIKYQHLTGRKVPRFPVLIEVLDIAGGVGKP